VPPAPSALSPTDSARRFAWALGAIAVAVVLVYANTWRAPFVFDDQSSILENPTILHLGRGIFSPPGGSGITVEGRPILNASLALNHAWSGMDVWSYHAVNLCIHVLAALTFCGLVRRTLRRAAVPAAVHVHATEIALAATALWALHPLQTESVTYIVQRTESLMGLLYLLTLYAFVRGCESEQSRRWFVVAVAACALGMATKEVMVSAPLLVLLYDRTFVAGSFRAAWARRWPVHLGLAATWLVLGYLLLGSGTRGGTIGAAAGVTWWQYAFCQARALVHYIGLALWPAGLTFDYGSDFVSFGEMLPFALVDLVLLGLTAHAIWRRPALGFLGAWFFLILAPTSSVVGGTRQMLAEHRMYLSLGALTVLVALAVHLWLGRRSWIMWSVLAIGLGWLTVRRNADYGSVVALYRDTVAKRPGNAYAHNNLGQALLLAGRTAEAVEEFRVALRLSPQRAMAHTHLAAALAKLGRTDDAVAEAEAALRENPNYAEARYNLATGLLRRGEPQAAIPQFEAALRLRPTYAEAACNLGVALLRAGRPAEAIQRLDEALRLRPDYSDAHFNLAVALQQQGQLAKAVEHYERALQLRGDYAEAHNNYGVALLRLDRRSEAMEHFRAALRVQPDYAEAHVNLGSALAEGGQWAPAVTEYEAALRLDPRNAQADFELGNALSALGRAREAIPHYEAAVRAQPDNAEFRNNLGGALLEGAQRVDDAIAQFNTALRLKPDSAETHTNLAVALADRGDRAEAVRHLEQALRLRPDYAFAREQLARLRSGNSP
jgi:tetratricopeptide (TPR) repeat protein